ncbi:MAG: acetyl-CoA carboxylase biotin carboxylase subunit [Cyclobacteriaceae bacterium]
MKIKKLLVANRGEISLRILRTAKELGIQTIAVYSDADQGAPYVRFADEAVGIGPSNASQSYLHIEKILEVAKTFKADAIHPGYGFLSENPEFARKIIESGLIFIGPTPEAMALMGNKLAAKKAVSDYGIPLVPGAQTPIQHLENAKMVAEKIGYPILIKASAGGGGKGMRIVHHPSEINEQLERAISEAQSSFGDPSVFIEKLILSPKHIEIQILADHHQNIVHLFERECSIQRRHQKVIEEAPSPFVNAELRAAMGKAAVLVAKACGYQGAGTVEFIVDKDRNFFFLEMNTRLQVEHPVTEMITGVDLVKEQIEIAEGNQLRFTQSDLKINGHALEVRVYAEDPQNNFLPSTGQLKTYITPKGPGIRVDDGYVEGMEIPVYYDPMIAKLIVYAENRSLAIEKMKRAIEEYRIIGVKTTLSFCHWVMKHESFQSGKFTTGFIEDYFKPEMLQDNFSTEELEIAALISTFHLKTQNAGPILQKDQKPKSPWRKNRI